MKLYYALALMPFVTWRGIVEWRRFKFRYNRLA
jgi:hypothetical protein